ncbi:MAG: hypothetical protein E2P06_04670 [Acidobacteria bacterium]|nr:hypothetical protein [Acidobacteriota bacterium]TDI25510.1 MAG: hypothetical protein E2P06_04670 [Acidobacteriota bacterium]
MTFDAGARPDPRALRDAVRRVDFTPTHIRFWVEGTIEVGPSHATLTLVSQATGQRFALAPAPGGADGAAFTALVDLRGTVTLWGLVETPEGGADIMLRVEGHETVRQ